MRATGTIPANGMRLAQPGRMKWSWKLGKLAGIDVNVHVTFLLLIAWIGIRAISVGSSLAGFAGDVGFILLLFACVVLHELGHALTARRFGIATRDITLLPIGGVARLERMPEVAWQELVVALAGPGVNLILAGGLLGLSYLMVGSPPAPLTATAWRRQGGRGSSGVAEGRGREDTGGAGSTAAKGGEEDFATSGAGSSSGTKISRGRASS